MAAYRRVDDCRLTACTPGSAPGPTLGNAYGKHLPFLLKVQTGYATATFNQHSAYISLPAVTTYANDPQNLRCY